MPRYKKITFNHLSQHENNIWNHREITSLIYHCKYFIICTYIFEQQLELSCPMSRYYDSISYVFFSKGKRTV